MFDSLGRLQHADEMVSFARKSSDGAEAVLNSIECVVTRSEVHSQTQSRVGSNEHAAKMLAATVTADPAAD
jgi:hypothetical protein